MTIEVLNDGKDNRAFRALNIKCWINLILSYFKFLSVKLIYQINKYLLT